MHVGYCKTQIGIIIVFHTIKVFNEPLRVGSKTQSGTPTRGLGPDGPEKYEDIIIVS